MKKFILQTAAAFLLVFFLSFSFYNAVADATIVTDWAQPESMVSNDNQTLSLDAAGDVMFTRGVGRAMEKYGSNYPLGDVESELKSADISFINLETAISSRGVPLPGKGIWFRSPPETIALLQEAGIDVASIANNHSLDYDDTAFADTLNLLGKGGIAAVGGGNNLREAVKPVRIYKDKLSAVFLAYSDMADIYWDASYPRMLRAADSLPGIAPLQEEQILSDLKGIFAADLVIVSLHWGVEYTDRPTLAQQQMAHKIIDAGADLIIGHHPHWFQGVEYYHGGLIAYSLGNFLFDQSWSKETQEGLLLKINFNNLGITSARLLPVDITGARAKIAEGATAQDILKTLKRLSAALNTNVVIDNDAAEVLGRLKENKGSF